MTTHCATCTCDASPAAVPVPNDSITVATVLPRVHSHRKGNEAWLGDPAACPLCLCPHGKRPGLCGTCNAEP